jgi:hypothetical protein
MEKLEIGTEVTVELTPSAQANLGISNEPKGVYKVAGHYPLGHYLEIPGGNGKQMAIADKYGALKKVNG